MRRSLRDVARGAPHSTLRTANFFGQLSGVGLGDVHIEPVSSIRLCPIHVACRLGPRVVVGVDATRATTREIADLLRSRRSKHPAATKRQVRRVSQLAGSRRDCAVIR
jgi:hypothetical protein